MTIEQEKIVKAFVRFLYDDREFYDLLPGDGMDDHILRNIRAKAEQFITLFPDEKNAATPL